MGKENENQNLPAPGTVSNQTLSITQADLDKMMATAVANALPGALSAARTAENERVAGIKSHAEAKDRPALAQALADEGMTVEQAARVMAAAPKEAKSEDNQLAKAMNSSENPSVGAGGGNEQRDDSPQGAAARIISLASRHGFNVKKQGQA